MFSLCWWPVIEAGDDPQPSRIEHLIDNCHVPPTTMSCTFDYIYTYVIVITSQIILKSSSTAMSGLVFHLSNKSNNCRHRLGDQETLGQFCARILCDGGSLTPTSVHWRTHLVAFGGIAVCRASPTR